MKTRTATGTSATLALFMAAGVASAGPAGTTVTSGSATFSTAGATTTVTTTTDNTIINYNTFNIGSAETVNFVLPGATSAVLNRINGGSPTNIDGTLLSNGRVYIVNPSGVMFGNNAVVNVGQLYAAAGNLSNQDFLAGRNNFTNATGAVTNHGNITGDFVGLIGASVANHGTITASHGTVVMAAGNDIYLSEKLGQWHVKVARSTNTGTSNGSIDLAAGDTYTLAAWHDGTTTADNILIASAGTTDISGAFATSDPASTGLLSITGDDILIGSGALAQPDDTIIDSGTVENSLNLGFDVNINADGSIWLTSGDSIDKTSGDEATLALSATGNITLDGTISNTSGSALNLTIDAGNFAYFNNNINLAGGALSAVAGDIAFGQPQDEQPDRFNAPETALLQAAVMEFSASNMISGAVRLSTNGTIGSLSAEGFAALSDALQIEMLGEPDNNDLAILLTSDFVIVEAPLWQSSNNGGLRLFTSGEIASLGSNATINLDGRFLQEGAQSVLQVGGSITTTGDDMLFAGDLYLENDLLLRANDGSGADALIGFAGRIDGDHTLSGDAGDGRVIALQDIGSQDQLYTLRLRGKTVDLYGDATSQFQQVYIADTLTLHGVDLTTTDLFQGEPLSTGGSDLAIAKIDVLADENSQFAGNLVITGDSSITTAGRTDYERETVGGDRVLIEGTTNSIADGYHTLTVDAGDASAIFGNTVGTGVDSGTELGLLDVTAHETELHGSVYTHGMNFDSFVAVHAESSTIHTGDGVAWFGNDVYSAEGEANSVEFLYSGDPEITLLANRTPFKFTGYVGAMQYGYDDRSSESEYAFTNIRFGDDRTTNINAASFLFADMAQRGNELTPYFSYEDNAYVYAYDSITMGRGQKVTSFGSLELSTGGESFGTVSIGDINVLGDLYIFTDQINLLARAPGSVEGVSTEQQRLDGNDSPTLIEDFAMEIIVSGDFVFEGDLAVSLPEGASLAAGPQAIILAVDQELFQVEGDAEGFDLVQLETVDQTLFESVFFDDEGPVRSDDSPPLYAYDLAITGSGAKRIDPNLGLGFNGLDRFDARYAGRYVPGAQVLSELALNPRSYSLAGHRDRAVAGSAIITDVPSNPNPGLADYSITLDRLSRGSVDRLKTRYTALFGDRIDETSDARTNTDALHTSIADVWTRYRSSGGEDSIGFAGWALQSDPVFFQTLIQIRDLIDAVDGLGLTPIDHRRAHARTLERIRPTGMEFGIIERMLQGIDQLVVPEPTDATGYIASR